MKKVLIVVTLIIAAWFVVRFVFGGPEDDWICQGGRWTKHGQPSAPRPTMPCEK